MLTNILILLAVSAGSLVAERPGEEPTVDTTVLKYADDNSVDTNITITDETVQLTSDGLIAIVNYEQKRIIVKPNKEETCMVIEGIEKLGEDFPTLEQMKKATKNETIGLPTLMMDLKVKPSKSRIKLSAIEETACPKTSLFVEITTAEGSATDITDKHKQHWHGWWPWWNWWPRWCPWCYYHYRWPCFHWPYWFYYYKYMFTIYPCW